MRYIITYFLSINFTYELNFKLPNSKYVECENGTPDTRHQDLFSVHSQVSTIVNITLFFIIAFSLSLSLVLGK